MRQRATAQTIVNNLPWLTLIVLLGLFTSINPRFMGPTSLSNIFEVAAPLLILSFGATFVIIDRIDRPLGRGDCFRRLRDLRNDVSVLGNWSILAAILLVAWPVA